MFADLPRLCAACFLTLAAIFAGVQPGGLRAAEEAVDANGRATPGVLALDADGRLRFTPKGKAEPLALDSIALIRFPVLPTDPFRVAFVRRLLMADGQRLTGRMLSLDDDALTLRTVWADRLTAPRSTLIALRQPPGRLSFFEDDFADGLKAWTVSGQPTVGGDPPAVQLSEPGQSLAYAPPEPLEEGRVGLNFQDKDAAGARWLAALHFQGAGQPQVLRTALTGPGDAYEVEPPGMDGDAHRVGRSLGWHRLTVRFSRASLNILCDDAVLWSNLRQGPGGTLREVTLSCVEAAKAGARRGRAEFAEFALTRTVDEPPRPPGDPTQEEVWLADGDQLFGDAVRISRRAVEIQGRFGKRSLPWSDVRGCWFKQAGPPPRPAQGAVIRVWIDSGLDPEPDVLDGVVKALNDKELVLQHASLGELHIPRERLRRLSP